MQNKAGDTSLHVASSQGSEDLVQIILAKCRLNDIRIREIVNKDSFTALHLAAKQGSRHCCEMLAQDVVSTILPWKSKRKDTCLHMAAYGGSVEVIEYILGIAGTQG